MRKAFQISREAFSIWWDTLMHMTFFNMLWVLAQFPIITGPPATAAMYALTARFMERDLIVPKDFFVELKRMFLPALKWGTLNLLVFGILVINFIGSIGEGGELWFCLRYAWLVVGILWYVLNLFYWPFWLSQDDCRVMNTYRNVFVMFLRSPVEIICLALICAVLIFVSSLTLFPLALALMVWLSLTGILMVRWAIGEIES
jgi:uncharacterized membrane protein YesL